VRQTFVYLFIISILLTACGAQAATPQGSTPQVIPTATNLPVQVATVTPAINPTPTVTSTPTAPPATRWFWAIGKNEILAFNAAGQVNSVLNITGIKQNGNDTPPSV
jgi:hypothetical protein